MWQIEYGLADGTESMRTLGPARVRRDPGDAAGWRARRRRPPAGALTQDAASARRAFLDQQTDRTPLERITLARCADAFLDSCRDKGRSPNTLRTDEQIVREVKAHWEDWRAVDVDSDELEDYRDELVVDVSTTC